MLTVVCADKGAPGATITALALASTWPSDSALLVEADPSGGDLGIYLTQNRQHLPPSPNVATVAAAARDDAQGALASAIGFSDGLSVIPGFMSSENGAGLTDLWRPLAAALSAAEADVIVDVGRTWTGTPALPLLDAADVIVVTMRQSASALLHARERIGYLRSTHRECVILPAVISAERDAVADRQTVDEILAANRLPVEQTAHLAWDPTGLAGVAAGQDVTSRALARSKFVRSARALAARVADYRAHELLREVV